MRVGPTWYNTNLSCFNADEPYTTQIGIYRALMRMGLHETHTKLSFFNANRTYMTQTRMYRAPMQISPTLHKNDFILL